MTGGNPRGTLAPGAGEEAGVARAAPSLDAAPCDGRHPEEVPRMRPTVPVFLSLILLAGLLPAPVEAGVIKCVKIELTQCRCKSPYRIRCGNAEGHVQWNALLGGVDVIIKDDRGRVKDAFFLDLPNVKDFNLDTIHEGDAFREHLESMGKLPRGHSYEIKHFWLNDRLPMFNDTQMEDEKGTIAEVDRRMEPPDRCFYTREPSALAIRSPDGHSTVICLGPVQCRPRNGGGEYTARAICLAPDIQGNVGSCPDATSCLAEDVPELRSFMPVPRSSR